MGHSEKQTNQTSEPKTIFIPTKLRDNSRYNYDAISKLEEDIIFMYIYIYTYIMHVYNIYIHVYRIRIPIRVRFTVLRKQFLITQTMCAYIAVLAVNIILN